MDRKRRGRRRAFLALEAPAGWPGDDGGRVQPLAVRVLVQRCVSRLRLILSHHKPGQRQVLDWWDRRRDYRTPLRGQGRRRLTTGRMLAEVTW